MKETKYLPSKDKSLKGIVSYNPISLYTHSGVSVIKYIVENLEDNDVTPDMMRKITASWRIYNDFQGDLRLYYNTRDWPGASYDYYLIPIET